MGIDPKRYWLLMDLFGQLSDRREILNQLGRDSSTLQVFSWVYFALMSFFGLVFALMGMAVATYFWFLMGITAFFLLGILIPETSNSLVNPIEGLILAHQPIDGATYTAAKLSHLVRILLYLVPGLSVGPALAGLLLKDAPWFYPLLHVAAAFAVGIVVALLCCAVFGWLIRFVPPRRLKAAGQVAEVHALGGVPVDAGEPEVAYPSPNRRLAAGQSGTALGPAGRLGAGGARGGGPGASLSFGRLPGARFPASRTGRQAPRPSREGRAGAAWWRVSSADRRRAPPSSTFRE